MTRHRQTNILMAVVGVVLLLAALWLLASNEHAAVRWRQGLVRHGGKVLMPGPDAAPAAGLDGKNVLLAGTPEVLEAPRDPDFHVRVDTPLLVRKVSMFQWHEVRADGTISYQQDWIGHWVDSSRFDDPGRHLNTQRFPFRSEHFVAPQVRLGHFILAPAIVRALPAPLRPATPDFGRLPANLQASFRVRDGMLTTAADAQHPRLGDLRVQWLAAPLEKVTVVARVKGDHLVPATHAGIGGKGFQVLLGQQSLTDVFADLPLPPGAVWAWRVLAVLLAWLGAWLVLRGWRPARSAVPVALAGSVAALSVLAGVLWLPVSMVVAVAAWVIAVLAVLVAALSWRRLA